jgi:phage terminase large subunit
VATRRIVIPYAPRGVFRPYHDRKQRWACLVAHRRCGKTVATINDLVRAGVTCPLEHGRFAYVAPFLAQAKEVAWDYLKRFAQPVLEDKNESELWVQVLGGHRIRVHGADNPDRLRGAYLDGLVLDEYADMRPNVWGEVIRPMLADRRGWATFIGTPKGRNEFHAVFERSQRDPDWYSAILRASETGLLPQAELDAARADMTPEQYAQEFECSFDAAILGAYYGADIAQAERDDRIGSVEIDPALPVHTAWDLGKGANMAIWCWQVAPGGIRVVDYVEGFSDKLSDYAAELNARGYFATEHSYDFVPHDAKASELGTGRTRVETLLALKRKPRVVADHKVMDGINATRVLFPRIWFDAERCRAGLEALRQYRAEYDERLKTFRNEPRHDWASHAADAFRYLAMAYREFVPASRPVDVLAELVRPRSFAEILEEHERETADD